MKQSERELEPPESFYKAKRALLLFCSISILFAIAKKDPWIALTFSGGSISLPSWLLPWLIWLTCVYLMFGFVREQLYVSTRYSEELFQKSLLATTSYLDKVEHKAAEWATMLEKNIRSERALMNGLQRVIDVRAQKVPVHARRELNHALDELSVQIRKWATSDDRLDPDKGMARSEEFDSLLENYGRTAHALHGVEDNGLIDDMKIELAKIPQDFEQSEASLQRYNLLAADVREIKQKLGRMSTAVPKSERLVFLSYDLVIPYLMFGGATFAPIVDWARGEGWSLSIFTKLL